ncbi:MAG: hypothetical protein AB8G95_16310 [Anaerolineae bacterium]
MDQGLKYMIGVYVSIFLVVGIFAFSTGNMADQNSVLAELSEKTKSVESDTSSHQPFNQVKFDNKDQALFTKTKSGDSSSHQALNIVKFNQSNHQAFNQVGFARTNSDEAMFGSSDKDKSGRTDTHKPLNIVRFESKSRSHQAFNVVGFEKKD